MRLLSMTLDGRVFEEDGEPVSIGCAQDDSEDRITIDGEPHVVTNTEYYFGLITLHCEPASNVSYLVEDWSDGAMDRFESLKACIDWIEQRGPEPVLLNRWIRQGFVEQLATCTGSETSPIATIRRTIGDHAAVD